MNDPDNFLRRWSRRKREAGKQPANEKSEEVTSVSARDEQLNSENSVPAATAPSVPEFDVSQLPPIESIGVDTDISVFMQKGVPSALRHAALRRAWSADPSIRDFVGLNENFWDAAGPDGILGFGDLDPGFDVKRMVAELFGENKPEPRDPNTSTDQVPVAESSPESIPTSVPAEKAAHPEEDSSPHAENAASQQGPRDSQPVKKIARRHGGAMPQ